MGRESTTAHRRSENNRVAGPVGSEVGAFRGIAQNYDASENADFASVIQNRQILPVSIGVLYIHLARSCNFCRRRPEFPRPFPAAHGSR